MRRSTLAGIGIAVAIVLAFCGLVVLWPASPVIVRIKNETRRTITSVELKHEEGIEVARGISAGQSASVRFRPRGETSYQLTVHFSDGSQTSGGGGYAEAGYRFTEHVSDVGIRTDVRPSYSQ
jgi:hypothetical protein